MKSVKGTQTEKNLLTSFAGESQARMRYNYFASAAKKEGYEQIYLNTHRYLEAAPAFWKSLGYEITVEEDDYDETTHMVKNL